MDSITNLFSGASDPNGWLAKVLSSPLLKVGMAGSGAIGNIFANRARNNVLSAEMNQMNMLNKLTPDQIIKGINQLKVPLSGNLINSVGNTVQGQMASRGLAQAPGIFAQAMGQGLAPYELQEQQMATDAFFKKLGLPISARPSPFGPFPNQTNTSQIWQSLMQQFMGLKDKLGSGGNQVPDQPPGGAGDSTMANIIQQILGGQVPAPGLIPSTPGNSGIEDNS